MSCDDTAALLPLVMRDLRFVPSLCIIALMQIRIGKEIMRQPILGIGKYCLLESRSGYGIVALFQTRSAKKG